MKSTRRQFLAGILATSGLLLTSVPALTRRPKMIRWETVLDDRTSPEAQRMHGRYITKAELREISIVPMPMEHCISQELRDGIAAQRETIIRAYGVPKRFLKS